MGLYVAHSCEVEHVCPIRSPIETLRLELWRLLTRTTLRDLATHPRAPRRPEVALQQGAART